ncbi:hypothetical protein [Pontivivens ytuae]|uniref:Uncharacterized protein n=1 Tax=Pontivivens ytuae TaxID=2789856 RepID=A0A7S9LRP6_9RHOB|nr:hypothetical protein [Pontivivens ytuae]QPH54013.1 hypothetical protein I0K15_19950 [Pontivivens ytuae]
MRPRLLLILAALVAAPLAAETPLPEIAAGLPDQVAEANAAFNARVQARFALPLAEDDLIAVLETDGFAVDRSVSFADIERRDGLCLRRYRVVWNNEGGTVDAIGGAYGLVCP